MLYAVFYVAIHHVWGAAIVTLCSVGFAITPFLMRAFRSVPFAGNFLAALMTLGFTALCYVEGGLRGHAVAWLASVTLCALLLIGKKASGVWVIVSFAATASVVAFDLAEIRLPVLYDPAWGPLVDATGYLGLIAFMFGLGLIFELGREQAFGKMTDALSATATANQRLNVANQEKMEFMGVAAHDLRNPLTIIITYAEMLREGDARKPKEFADSIYQAGRRMKDLITKLLDANAIDEGRFSCEIERCELAPLIATSVSQNQINATRKETEIVLLPAATLGADRPRRHRADSRQPHFERREICAAEEPRVYRIRLRRGPGLRFRARSGAGSERGRSSATLSQMHPPNGSADRRRVVHRARALHCETTRRSAARFDRVPERIGIGRHFHSSPARLER